MIHSGEKALPGAWCGMLMRKRYIDEKLLDSLDTIDSIVNLGAGLDTRAFRLKELHSVPMWELDQADNIAAKQTRLKRLSAEVPKNLSFVAIDFDKEDISEALAQNGYSRDAITFFIWEGVTQYLTKAGIEASFAFLSTAPKGSLLAFTYVLRDFLEGRNMYGWEKAHQKYVCQDKIWLFGLNSDEWPPFLAQYGWRLLEDKDAAELAERYAMPRERKLLSSPIERMAFAEKA